MRMYDEEPKKKVKKKLFFDEHGDPRPGMIITAISVSLITLLVFIGIVSEFYQVVQPAHVGLVIKGGELQEEPLGDGFYMKTPFWTEIVPVSTKTLSTDNDEGGLFKDSSDINPFRAIQPLSKDGQVLEIDTQISYAIVDAIKFREVTGSTDPRTIEQLLFVPTIRKLVYDYASEYGWKGLIQGGERQEFGQRVFTSLASGEVTKRTCSEETKKKDELTGTEIIVEAGCMLIDQSAISKPSDYGVLVVAVNFKKIKPNDKIIKAVEEAQAKEQEVKVAREEAKIATEVANKAIEEKRGQTESEKLQADVDAYKVRKAKEEEAVGVSALAKAQKELTEALRGSQDLVEYKKLEIQQTLADAQVEFAKHYTGQVPNSVQIIGTDEAKDMNIFYGMPNVVANP